MGADEREDAAGVEMRQARAVKAPLWYGRRVGKGGIRRSSRLPSSSSSTPPLPRKRGRPRKQAASPTRQTASGGPQDPPPQDFSLHQPIKCGPGGDPAIDGGVEDGLIAIKAEGKDGLILPPPTATRLGGCCLGTSCYVPPRLIDVIRVKQAVTMIEGARMVHRGLAIYTYPCIPLPLLLLPAH